MSFNTVDAGLKCPFCQALIESGVGFRVGALTRATYKIGDKISWDGGPCNPVSRPTSPVIKAIGHYNCDNIKCSTWSDCFPEVLQALVIIENDVITSVEHYQGVEQRQDFAIIEP